MMRPPKRNRNNPPEPTPSDTGSSEPLQGERLQKILARAGLGSRREIEQSIREGRIQLNGQTAELGARFRPGDRLHYNGRPVDLVDRMDMPTRVLLYHKPVGEVVSRRDPEGRPVIFTQLPRPTRGRWVAVGRLDLNTQGLLLVTTNGELANRLMHPSREIEREYAVRVLGDIGEHVLKRLTDGVALDDGPARFETITPAGGEGANRWYKVTLREGRNRIVRRLWDSQGVTVSRLIRIRFGDLDLPPRLKARTFTELTPEQVDRLLVQSGLPAEQPTVSPSPGSSGRRPAPRRR